MTPRSDRVDSSRRTDMPSTDSLLNKQVNQSSYKVTKKATSKQHTVRSASENKERAYIAASRRGDRSIEARVASAHEASKIHKERTGKSLKITQSVVEAEEMYEEEEDAPRHFAYNLSHLPGRFQTYAAVHMGIAGEAAKIERDFEKYFGHQLPASQGASAAHLQYGPSPIASGIQSHIPLSLATRFDPRTQLAPGQVMQSSQRLATTPISPAGFARAAPPGPLQIPDNASFLGMNASPQAQLSPYTPGMSMGLPYRPPSSQHAQSPRHVSSPAVSFGDHASPLSTSSHYASPLHTPIHETSPMSATFQRSRSGSYTDIANATRGPLIQHRIPSFDVGQAAEPLSHPAPQTSAWRQAERAVLRAQRAVLQRQQSSGLRARQHSEGSILGPQGSLAHHPATVGNGMMTAAPMQQRRLSEQGSVCGNQTKPPQGRFETSMFTPQLPANVQGLVYGPNKQGLSCQQSSQGHAMGPPESVPRKMKFDDGYFSQLSQLPKTEAHTEHQDDTATPAEDGTDAEPFWDGAGAAGEPDLAAGRVEMMSISGTGATKIKEGEKSHEANKDHNLEEQSPGEDHPVDNVFSQFLLEGGMDFPYATGIVDNSIGATEDPFFTGNQPFDVSDNSFDFNMDDFVDFPQSQPNDDGNNGGDDH